MIYGEKLKELREENHLLQKDLAKLLDVHVTAYSQFEREYTIIPINQLEKICNYYDISLDYIFGFTNEKQYPSSTKKIDIELSSTRLKELRKNLKLSQIKLASILNTAFSTISAYERKRYVIATPYLYTICKKYNVSADYLLGKISYLP